MDPENETRFDKGISDNHIENNLESERSLPHAKEKVDTGTENENSTCIDCTGFVGHV